MLNLRMKLNTHYQDYKLNNIALCNSVVQMAIYLFTTYITVINLNILHN